MHFFADENVFINRMIASNRGKPLFMIRFERIRPGIDAFASHLKSEMSTLLLAGADAGLLTLVSEKALLLCLAPGQEWNGDDFPNIDRAFGRFQEDCARTGSFLFDFGVGRTQCNFLSGSYEVFQELSATSLKNLKDNLVRKKWTLFNRANMYLAGAAKEAMIQPTVVYNPTMQSYSVKGGELFIGGGDYQNYRELLADLPDDQNLNRFELLILEKLITAAGGLPGVLKFNISPQSFLDTFDDPLKIRRMVGLLQSRDLPPERVLFELVEKPFTEESGGATLKDVCRSFWEHGIGFAADDFGVKSQSHQVVLELGVMIREFKLDPMSYHLKAADDRIKFLDNLVFIAYCRQLADNRNAVITAEAVQDLETLRFLQEHQIHQFQSNLFCGKIPVEEYRELFPAMQHLPAADFERRLVGIHCGEADHLPAINVFNAAPSGPVPAHYELTSVPESQNRSEGSPR